MNSLQVEDCEKRLEIRHEMNPEPDELRSQAIYDKINPEPVPKATRLTISEVREAGRQAYRDNMKITDNPHDNPHDKRIDLTCNWAQWITGWQMQRDAVRW